MLCYSTSLFNIQQGVLPEDQQCANVISIFKKRLKTEATIVFLINIMTMQGYRVIAQGSNAETFRNL